MKLLSCFRKKKYQEKKYPYCDIHNEGVLAENNIILPHPIGIVISRAAKLGKNLIIYQNVTIGAKNYKDGDFTKPQNYPTIKDNTIIYAGAVIAGPVTIGENCVVGANAVVTTDVPDNCYAVGNPAKIIAKK